ncbi:MAG: peptidylprolyl isomerase [Gammaproteobacteria bacterium]
MTIFTATAKTRTLKFFAIAALSLGTMTMQALAASPAPATSGAPAPATAAPLPGQPLDRVVAVANDQPILESTLNQRVAEVSAALQSQGTPVPPEAQLRHQILERLIVQKIEIQAAQNQGIQVSADQVNSALSEVASRNGLTLAQLPKALSAQGQSYLAFRRHIKDQLTVHQLVQQVVASNIDVSSAEVDEYLKREANSTGGNTEYQLAQILVAFQGQATAADVKTAKSKAESLVKRLRAGANFAALAAANSAGPHALKGGVIGWINAANLPTLLEDAVPQMKPGDISAPIAGPGGYHIVKLLSERTAGSNKTTMQYHVRHIILKPNPVRDMAQSKTLAEKLRKEIASGKTSFAAAAKQYSDDPNTAGSGGDLGWMNPSALPPAFTDVIKNLPVNKVSAPIKTPYGWDLAEVLGKRKRNASKEEQKHKAYQAIYQRKLQEQLAQFTRAMRSQAYVHIYDSADAGSGDENSGG